MKRRDVRYPLVKNGQQSETQVDLLGAAGNFPRVGFSLEESDDEQCLEVSVDMDIL